MLSNRIEQVLERIGLTNLPENKQAKLEQGGLDSLMLALLIIELEREFEIKIPVIPLEKEHYESINTIEQYLIELGGKMNILITGGSSDIAQAIAKRRSESGDKIIITCSNDDSLNETLAIYRQHNIDVTGFIYNFSDPQACENDLELILREPLDGIILNAFTRVTQLRKLHALPYHAVRTYLDNNLNGNIWLIHRLLPALLKNKFGRLVLISSLSATAGTSRYPVYCTAKAALEGLFLNLAVDYSANNILSNIVRVGLIKTSRTEQFWKNPAYQEKVIQIIPQGTMGEPTQVAEAIDPLLSKTSFMTGSVVTVSGGLPLMRSEGLLS